MKKILVVLVLVFLVGCVSSQQDKKIQQAIFEADLQGKWKVVSVNGQSATKESMLLINNKNFDLTIAGKNFWPTMQSYEAVVRANKTALMAVIEAKHPDTTDAYKEALYNLVMSGRKKPLKASEMKFSLIFIAGKKDALMFLIDRSSGEQFVITTCQFKFIDKDNLKLWDFRITEEGKTQMIKDFYVHLMRV